jgi:hypothetical protein
MSLSPTKNTQNFPFRAIFGEMVDFRMGYLTFDPILDPHMTKKKIYITFFFLIFHVDFEKRIHFSAFSHPKMII